MAERRHSEPDPPRVGRPPGRCSMDMTDPVIESSLALRKLSEAFGKFTYVFINYSETTWGTKKTQLSNIWVTTDNTTSGLRRKDYSW